MIKELNNIDLKLFLKSANFKRYNPISDLSISESKKNIRFLLNSSLLNHNEIAKNYLLDYLTKIRAIRSTKKLVQCKYSKFTPELLQIKDNLLVNIANEKHYVKITDFFDKIDIEKYFSKAIINVSKDEEIYNLFKTHFVNSNESIEKILNQKKLNFSITALPIIIQNPIYTDCSSIGINIATILFLIKLNLFTKKLSFLLGKRITSYVKTELKVMQYVFSNITDNEINKAILEIEQIKKVFNLDFLEIHFLKYEIQNTEYIPAKEELFINTFKKCQFDVNVPLNVLLFWHGVINKEKFNELSINTDYNSFNQYFKNFNEKAYNESYKLAFIKKQIIWKDPKFIDCIELSIRTGSKRLCFIPVSINKSNKILMHPAKCNIGIESNQIVTLKRADFLLNPLKWIEIITEYGSLFISRLFWENIKEGINYADK